MTPVRMECTVEECPNGATKKIGFPFKGGWAEVVTCDDHAPRWAGLDGAEIVKTYVPQPDDWNHIRLICWEHKHVQAWSKAALRQIVIAPLCGAPLGTAPHDVICMSLIWAVEHEGEPTMYIGKPPHRNWASWAECIPPHTGRTEGSEK